MSKYQISPEERWATFEVHGGICYLCEQPIDFRSMWVDHVLAEHLLGDPPALRAKLQELALPPDFNINSFDNWLPSCTPCNKKKGGMVVNAAALVLVHLKRASKGAARAREIVEKMKSDRAIQRALTVILSAVAGKKLSDIDLMPIIEAHRNLHEGQPAIPLRLTPHCTVLFEGPGYRLVQGPRGVGAVPISTDLDGTYYCFNCGERGPWNGATCMTCGQRSEE